MATYVVELEYGADREERLRVRPEHREYCRDLAERGVVLAGGPFADETGAMLIYEVADAAELRAVLEADPYAAAGVLASTTIREWNVVTGSWAR
ncbi:YciI family protein [Salinifilum aidingensis]